MRLLYTGSDGQLQWTKDLDGQEVTFDDLKTLDHKAYHSDEKSGYRKLRFCAHQAKCDSLDFFWVDTCCIDKSNSAELSEAINSMFFWYQSAKRCYVYLPDVDNNEPGLIAERSKDWEQAFMNSRWFTRGWTLQELLAPSSVEFFSSSGVRLGDRESLKDLVHRITLIPVGALSGQALTSFSVDERLFWTASRQTTRGEDNAYCLLGIFGIFMPPIYGEGKENAVRRLHKKVRALTKSPDWLSVPDPSSNYHRAMEQRSAGTGLWFLESADFSIWKRDPASQLWLYGIPGCGKTILSSTIVENLLHDSKTDTSLAAAYFFFDFSDGEKQLVGTMLCSMIAQLRQHLSTMPPTLEALFTATGGGKRQPARHILLEILHQTIAAMSQVYIVIDALDECIQRGVLLDFLTIMSGWKLQNLHVLVTSRKERDIEERLLNFINHDNSICLQTEMVDKDIHRYIQQRLLSDRGLAKWQNEASIRQEIEICLTSGARGMFRWASCQLDVLAKCRNRAMLLEALATLPSTLDETYERVLCSISEEDSKYARRMLKWLACSARPMYACELAEVVAIDDKRDIAFEPTEILEDQMDALDICSSLITVTTHTTGGNVQIPRQRLEQYLYSREAMQQLARREGLVVSLAHYSVQEYLLSRRIRDGPARQYSLEEDLCHSSISTSCLKYFSETHDLERARKQRSDRDIFEQHSLREYVAQFWDHHLQKTTSDDIADLAVNLLSFENPAYFAWLEYREPDFTHEWPDLTNYRVASPLYCAASMGLVALVKLLLERGVEVDTRLEHRWKRPLHAAIIENHHDVVKILLDAGASVDRDTGYYGTALYAAAEHGREQITRTLIMAGANVNAHTPHSRSRNALSAASSNGYDRVVTMLLDNGADISTLEVLHPDTERVLVTSNDDFSELWLASAAFNGQFALTGALIDHGARPNATDDDGCTPLFWASSNGHHEVVQLLLDRGANHNIATSRDMTALIVASGRNHPLVVECLLSRGAALDSRNSSGWTALYEAASENYLQVAKLLLQHGADPSIADPHGQTPLLSAAGRNHTEMVRLLLDHGVSAAIGENHPAAGPACQYLAWNGHADLLRTIIETGDVKLRHADLHHADSQGRTTIEFAALRGHAEVFQILLEQGLELRNRNSQVERPIDFAALGGSLDVAKLAMNVNGLITDAHSGRWTALHWACKGGNRDVIEFLIANGWTNQNVVLSPKHKTLEHSGSQGRLASYAWPSPISALKNLSKPLSSSETIVDLPGNWTPLAIAIFHRHKEMVLGLSDHSKAVLGVKPDIVYDQGTQYIGATCDGCLQMMYGPRFCCHTCGNFDYCFMCRPFMSRLHDNHMWEQIEPPDPDSESVVAQEMNCEQDAIVDASDEPVYEDAGLRSIIDISDWPGYGDTASKALDSPG